MQSVSEYGQKLKIYGKSAIAMLSELHYQKGIKSKNKKFENAVNRVDQVVYDRTNDIRKTINSLTENLDWASFNIAFFGETNAGKSTILEALTGGDGQSIGEGYPDNTKKLTSRAYENINLLDMPGIEGEEYKYKHIIQRAVEKSHVVFYVIGTNKEPEEETINKIKSFLKDRAKIYVIINKRNKATAYKYMRKELCNEHVSNLSIRVEEKFKSILGKQYAGCLCVHGLFAFVSKGNLSREGFIKDKEKCIEVFGSDADTYEFSGLKNLERLIRQISTTGYSEILISNTYEFLTALEIATSQLVGVKKDFDSLLKKLDRTFRHANKATSDLITKHRESLIFLIEQETDNLKHQLVADVYGGIDEGYSKTKYKQIIKKQMDEMTLRLKERIDSESKEIQSEVDQLLQDFDTRMEISLKFSILAGTVNINQITDKLHIGLKYVLQQIVDLGLDLPLVFGAARKHYILGIAAGIWVALKKVLKVFFRDPKKRRHEAKQQAYFEITKSIKSMKKKHVADINKKFELVESDLRRQFTKIHADNDNLWKLSDLLGQQIQRLGEIKATVSTELAREVLGDEVRRAYIDLQLGQMAVIGLNIDNKDLSIFRLPHANAYKSKSHFISSTKHTHTGDGVLVTSGRDKFTNKALCVFQEVSSIRRSERGGTGAQGFFGRQIRHNKKIKRIKGPTW